MWLAIFSIVLAVSLLVAMAIMFYMTDKKLDDLSFSDLSNKIPAEFSAWEANALKRSMDIKKHLVDVKLAPMETVDVECSKMDLIRQNIENHVPPPTIDLDTTFESQLSQVQQRIEAALRASTFSELAIVEEKESTVAENIRGIEKGSYYKVDAISNPSMAVSYDTAILEKNKARFQAIEPQKAFYTSMSEKTRTNMLCIDDLCLSSST